MFTVYHSNRWDPLKTLAASIITKNPIRNPFQPEVILVQNKCIAQWMQIELATHLSVAANIKFYKISNFIWEIFSRVLPNAPNKDTFSRSEMTWRIMKILPRIYHKPDFSVIRKYLHDDHNMRKIFQLASHLADLFNQYLIYRPDWLEMWQKEELIDNIGECQIWQAQLWQILAQEIDKEQNPLCNYSNLYQSLIQVLEKKINPPKLPNRIFICGTSVLPPTYLQVLQALGKHIDIHLLFINPSPYYWGGIHYYSFLSCPPKPQSKNHQGKKQVNYKISNPLLTSWGKQGLDNINLLAQIDGIVKVDAFIEPSGNSLLKLLQRDILTLEDHSVTALNSETPEKSNNKRLLSQDDYSLSLNICHSPQREVEVLHDNLLSIMTKDSTLQLRDIIVMITDIKRYTPAIQAVFGNISGERYLPFFISDKPTSNLHPVLSTFLDLLALPYSRFSAEQVIALLEVPAVAARFAIKKEELQLLRRWVTESGIRWGLDDETFRKLILPVTSQYTWKFGLTRMLLGYAMTDNNGAWQGVLPYNESSGLIARLVGQLFKLLTRLCKWREQLTKPRTLEAWLECCHLIIEDFFAPDVDIELLLLLKNQWQKILQCGLCVGYRQPVPVTLLQEELTIQLKKQQNSHQFLPGAINFCTLDSMRSVTFRVVCILGMNDSMYPRKKSINNLNLIAKNPRPGDYNQRDNDRYLFLQTLLSAQQQLYISFIGRTIQDNTPCYPSFLIRELTDYITKSFYISSDKNLNMESSKKVQEHICQWHSRMPFAPDNFLPSRRIQSFANEWLPAARAKGIPKPGFATSLPAYPCKKVTIDELLCFYRNPVRAWFTQRLGIYLEKVSIKLENNETFIVNNLVRYQLNETLLNTLISGGNIDQLFLKIRAAGLLPYGVFGEIYWKKQCYEMKELLKKTKAWRLPETDNLKIFLKLGDTTLSGWLFRVQKNGLLRERPGVLSIKDGFLLWLEHLIYCAMGNTGESRMFGINSTWHFLPLPQCQAKIFLLSLVSGYFQGMTSLLLLLPRSGSAWLNHCYDPVTKSINRGEIQQKQARNKLIQAWKGSAHFPGESKNPYLQRLIRQLNEKDIEKIILATEKYFLPPVVFNQAQNTKMR